MWGLVTTLLRLDSIPACPIRRLGLIAPSDSSLLLPIASYLLFIRLQAFEPPVSWEAGESTFPAIRAVLVRRAGARGGSARAGAQAR
eukprot:3616497-Pyramimonas_sp.AAC.1